LENGSVNLSQASATIVYFNAPVSVVFFFF
jgi:hypothetical protein